MYDALSQNTINKLIEINKFKNILQISKTFQKQFINQISDQIISNKDKWYKLFKIRDFSKSNKKPDRTQLTIKIIKNIIKTWSGYTFKLSEKRKQIRVNGKRIDITDYLLYSDIENKPNIDVIETML